MAKGGNVLRRNNDALKKHQDMINAREAKAKAQYAEKLSPEKRARLERHNQREQPPAQPTVAQGERSDAPNVLINHVKRNTSFSTLPMDIKKEFDDAMKNDKFANGSFKYRSRYLTNKMIDMEAGSRATKARGKRDMNAQEAENLYKETRQSVVDENRKFLEGRRATKNQDSNNGSRATRVTPEAVPTTSAKDMKFEHEADGRGAEYAANKATRRAQFAESKFNHARTNEDVRNTVQRKLGLDDDGMKDYMGMDQQKRMELYGNQVSKAAAEPGFVDHMMGNKVPHIAGGALGTAWLVNQMSANKGQQSNAQLYGQQGFY